MSLLGKLQTADERTKTRLVIALTALATTVVLVLWLLVFGGPKPLPSAGEDGGDFSFWRSVRGGTATVWEKFFGREEIITP